MIMRTLRSSPSLYACTLSTIALLSVWPLVATGAEPAPGLLAANTPAGSLPPKVQAPHGQPDAFPHAVRSLRLAIADLIDTYGDRYPNGAAYVARLHALEKAHTKQLTAGEGPSGASQRDRISRELDTLRREALLANPRLDFDRLLLIKRGAKTMGLPRNWESNSSLKKTGYDDEIAVLSPIRGDRKLSTIFKPNDGAFVGDVDLHFGAERMLFSMPGGNGRWQVWEMRVDGTDRRELPLIHEPDVDNYDACYLPDGRIIFSSTAPFVGVPCVRGNSHVTNLYIRETDGSIRQLTVDQDHDWCPTVLNDGHILYLRWEYTDTPHAFNRILFQMNPDGTEQTAYYGSNSYWPNAMFYARPIPDDPTKVIAVVGGHHDNPRMGELVLFDRVRGQYEADGVVQRIPGYGKKVEPILRDGLTRDSWPRFLHPYPLSAKDFLVSCRPSPEALWGIYLVDVFDNFVLLYEEPGYAMLEPIPLRKRRVPPVIPDRVDPTRDDAVVFMSDVYAGDGLKGIPRGTIKSLRLIGYHFAYHGMGGQIDRVGLDGPWDIKRIIGTVPVQADGSAKFRVPAYTPIAVQPLDAEGKAVQLMRSWFTAMPGEVLSCVGCHESHRTAPPTRTARAAARAPSEIKPWYGPARGFSFVREVQPVLDKYCVGCHNGRPGPNGQTAVDLTRRPPVATQAKSPNYNRWARFTPAYYALRRFVRSPTIESDLHMLPPCEFHADTTKLVQMLRKGHHNVRLDAEAWDRLITWIDLHAPAHGSWTEVCGRKRVEHLAERRRVMRKRYAGLDETPEVLPEPLRKAVKPVMPKRLEEPAAQPIACAGWPFDAAEARRRQAAHGGATTLSIDLGDSVALELVRIPAGRFVMGDAEGDLDERPLTRVTIDKPYWMGRFEITNEQYATFDASHDSRLEPGDFLQFDQRERGYAVNQPKQPVVRVSWDRAVAFCRWLSQKTGRAFTLPTEAQWEYACRAGTATPLWYGDLDTDFSRFANVSDATHQSVDTFGWALPSGAIPPWRPADTRFNDHARVSVPVGTYQPNPWGLYDMHGNVAEWTCSPYRPYPYDPTDPREQQSATTRRVVRGGSWYDRPKRTRSAHRLAYRPYQSIYDVGFRVICEAK